MRMVPPRPFPFLSCPFLPPSPFRSPCFFLFPLRPGRWSVAFAGFSACSRLHQLLSIAFYSATIGVDTAVMGAHENLARGVGLVSRCARRCRLRCSLQLAVHPFRRFLFRFSGHFPGGIGCSVAPLVFAFFSTGPSQVLVIGGTVILLMLVIFIFSCTWAGVFVGFSGVGFKVCVCVCVCVCVSVSV